MKKLNAMIVLLAISAGMFAQFNCVGWVGFSNHPADFAAEPYAKLSVDAPKAGFAVEIDDLDELGIPELWAHLEANGATAQSVTNNTSDDGGLGDLFDLDGDATFGSQFMTFWDDDYLYVMLKYVDANSQTDLDQTRWEICYQTAEADRYEAGYQAATGDVDLQNQQYAGFIELGAGKAVLGTSGVTESARSEGSTGSWASAIGAAGTTIYNWGVDGDNTTWAVVGMAFEDFLIYYTDPLDASAGTTSLDPTVITQISFDVQSNSYPGETGNSNRMAHFWSANHNDGYALVYYNGYLNFSDETFPGVSTNDIKVSDRSAYIYDNVLRLKGFDTDVDLEIYSVVGQKVMAANNVSTLNVSELNNGIYIVKVAGEKQAFKVVKQ